MTEKIFRYLTIALAVVSAYLLWSDPRGDYTFFAVILMICAAFLSYRFRLKERLASRQAAESIETLED
jgi:drug/metabolite transporter (DMT)-like permease